MLADYKYSRRNGWCVLVHGVNQGRIDAWHWQIINIAGKKWLRISCGSNKGRLL